MVNKDLLNYTIQLADDVMILGHRVSEWTGHGPVLEQDIALTNISLDLIGKARNLYQYAAKQEGNGKTEDDYPFKRDAREWTNALLVEQKNGDFAQTIVRQFLFDCYHFYHLKALSKSTDEQMAYIGAKSVKEAKYHLQYSAEWMVRLGDGTEESHNRMQQALEDKIHYFEELFIPTKSESKLLETGIAPDLSLIKEKAYAKLNAVLQESTLSLPEDIFPQQGGRKGNHTEYLGFILAELQYMQKSYPNLTW
ncbi:MAG TPA: phenylacetate-CoA oxygenase subunit PaaI [Saprospirales bacterium]|nr:phenylacetate-CoA oxygenase subunit PaaI [Saprospirales bacterium]